MVAQIKRTIPYHVFLFAIAPILILLGNNIDQVEFSAGVRSLLLSIFVAGVLFIFLRLILKRWLFAAGITSIGVVLFYSYGHVYEWVRSLGVFGLTIGRHRFLLPIWFLILASSFWWLRKKERDLSRWTAALNTMALVTCLLPVIQILTFRFQSWTAQSRMLDLREEEGSFALQEQSAPPDIYYFILDGYTRDDVLLEVFQYDNSPFLERLEEMGFYIARCGRSNYSQTNLAMASTFNMDYLQNLKDGAIVRGTPASIPGLIRQNKVRSLFEDLEYTIVAFETGFYAIQWMDADFYLAPPRSSSVGEFVNVTKINGFEAMLLRTSAVWILIDAVNLPEHLHRFIPDLDYPNEISRERTLFVLDQFEFERVPSIQGPKFVYTHLIMPHFPYVFDQEGNFVKEDLKSNDLEGYRNQLNYTNLVIEPIVRDLVQNSNTPPVVILQGDHGMRKIPEERVAILNAYYLPGGGTRWLYPSISPVNSFRVILNHYFGGNFELLDDESYFSSYKAEFDFLEVPETSTDCAQE